MFERVWDLLQFVQYRDWTPLLHEKGDGLLFQWTFFAYDAVTGIVERQACRKWYLSQHATDSEIVQTVFKAALVAEEHEAREAFKYKGVALFGPHFDVEARLELAGKVDVRV